MCLKRGTISYFPELVSFTCFHYFRVKYECFGVKWVWELYFSEFTVILRSQAFFGVRRIRPNGILSPPYPEVTLDNFSFLVGGRSAARRPVFRPPGRIFARKSVFCYRTPDFVNGPFVTLCETVDLAPSDRFLNFSFPSYGCFREGDPQNGDS